MDIKKLDTVTACDRGAEMEIIDPATGKGSGAFIRVAGVDSHVYRKAFDNMADRLSGAKISADERRKAALEVLASCTLNWRGLESDGEPWPYTHENAMALYESSPSVRDQVDAFLSDRQNFLRD